MVIVKHGFGRAINCPTLIGRSSELESIKAAVGRPSSGKAPFVLISGEAGIGKSRLLREVRVWALAENFAIFHGNCFQTDMSTPYAPLLDLFRSALAVQAETAPLERFKAAIRHDLAPAFPELVPAAYDNPAGTALDPEQERRRLFSLMGQLFVDAAQVQPVVLVIEDVHWSDDNTLEFLLYLARRSSQYPLTLLVTYRHDEIHPPLYHWLAQLDREHLAHELRLSPLTRQDVSQMLQRIFNAEGQIASDFLDSLYTLTDGNPFFIEEVLKSLLLTAEVATDADILTQPVRDDWHIPRTVQASVQQRLAQLSPEARKVAVMAAVAGRQFDFTLLQALLPCDEHQLLQWIRELIDIQLVVEESDDAFAFRHALTRQAIYSDLLARERKTLHLLIGRTGEQLYQDSIPAHATELAYHFYQAGEWSEALTYAQQAGERALSLYTPRAAIDFFTKALHATAALNRTDGITALYQLRGQAYELLGDFEAARLDYEAAQTAASQENDLVSVWKSLIALGFLWSGRAYAQAGAYFQQALEVAVALNNPILEARSLNRYANWLVNAGHTAEALPKHRQALLIFEQHHDRQGMAETNDLLGMANGIHGDLPRAVEHYEQAIRLFRETGDTLGLISSLSSYGTYNSLAWSETVYTAQGSPEEAGQCGDEALQLARRIGALTSQAFGEWTMALFHGLRGDFGQGFSHAQIALQIAQDIRHQQWMTAAHFTFGQLYLFTLRPEAIDELETGLALAHQLDSAWWIGHVTASLSRACLVQKDAARAEGVLRAVLPPDRQPVNLQERRMRLAWGHLFLAQEKPEAALGIAEELIASIPPTAAAQPVPSLLNLKGDALLQLERFAEALQAYTEAASAAQEQSNYPLLWQLLCGRGWSLRQLQLPGESASSFALARDVVARLANSLDDTELAQSFLQASAAWFPADSLKIAHPAGGNRRQDGLTRREREVAALLLQNRTNREIADELVIGERTVESHVSSILSKLGLTSRREIAEWAEQSKLTNQ